VNASDHARSVSGSAAFLLGVVGPLLLAMALPLLAQAASPDLPPRPTPVSASTPTPPDWPLERGFIELRVRFAQAELWTLVQWQDGLGGWHDVEGWQGTLDKISNGEGRKVWWVAEANFGQGPFRWVVCQDRSCKRVVFSAPFNLPRSRDEAVGTQVVFAP